MKASHFEVFELDRRRTSFTHYNAVLAILGMHIGFTSQYYFVAINLATFGGGM
jgi:hypothetical protein